MWHFPTCCDQPCEPCMPACGRAWRGSCTHTVHWGMPPTSVRAHESQCLCASDAQLSRNVYLCIASDQCPSAKPRLSTHMRRKARTETSIRAHESASAPPPSGVQLVLTDSIKRGVAEAFTGQFTGLHGAIYGYTGRPPSALGHAQVHDRGSDYLHLLPGTQSTCTPHA